MIIYETNVPDISQYEIPNNQTASHSLSMIRKTNVIF